VFHFLMQHLHQILAALLVQRGDVEPDHRSVVRWGQPKVRRDDRLLDRLDEVAIPWLDDDLPCLRRADRGERDERGRRSVRVDLERLDETRSRATGAHACQLVLQRIDRLPHPGLHLSQDVLERHYLLWTSVPMCSPLAARTIASGCEMSNTMMGIPRSSARAAAVASMMPSRFSRRSRYVSSSYFFAPRTTCGSASYTPSTRFLPMRIASASISAARSAAAVSLVKKGFPVPAAKITTEPFSS